MKYLNSLNHYRALSIVFIVASHAVYVSEVKFDNYFSQFTFNFISGSTINFVFISGFLFYEVFFKRYEYRDFVKGRINRLLKPYLFLSILPILLCMILVPQYWDNSSFVEYSENSTWLWSLISIFKYLITGAHITAYWYIPFIVVLVLMSPLHISFIKLKTKQQVIVFLLLLLVAAFVQRPYERTSLLQAIHSVMFFTPLYLLGILCAIKKDKIYKHLKGKEFALFTVVVLLTMLQTYKGQIGVYKTEFLVYNGFDINLIKMIFMCLFFMVWLHNFENFESKTINILANTSFAIYFLHVYFLKIFVEVKNVLNLNITDYTSLVYIITTIGAIVFSVLVAKFINKALPNYSYILIGYGKKPNEAAD